MQYASMAMQGIGDLFYSLADMEDEQTKESFEKQKGLQIAGATMSMLGGITAAISGLFTTKSGPWDIALAAIQAASIAASGIANIVQIRRQTFDGKGGGTVTPNTSTGGISAVQAPLTYTEEINSASIESNTRDASVVVMEKDISDTQSRVRVSSKEATF